MAKLKIGIAGAGRMGLSIADLVAVSDDLVLAGIWARDPGKAASVLAPEDAYIGDDPRAVIERSDVLLDFSLPRATNQLIAAIEQQPVPLVCGVSGLADAQLGALRDLSSSTPIVYDRNMSVGVTVLSQLVRDATAALGPDFSVTIDDTHHVHKQDAPSGTALKLGEQVAAARGTTLDALWHDGPEQAAEPGQLRFAVERRGDIPGDHAVNFVSGSERLSLSHSVTTRAVFAEGALAAARWVVGQQAGFFGMQDVLFTR